MTKAIGGHDIRASFSPPIGCLNCAARPRFSRADERCRYIQSAVIVSHLKRQSVNLQPTVKIDVLRSITREIVIHYSVVAW